MENQDVTCGDKGQGGTVMLNTVHGARPGGGRLCWGLTDMVFYQTSLQLSDISRLRPTVSLGVTSALVYTYGCGDGRIGPTRCAVIGGRRGSRARRGRGVRRIP